MEITETNIAAVLIVSHSLHKCKIREFRERLDRQRGIRIFLFYIFVRQRETARPTMSKIWLQSIIRPLNSLRYILSKSATFFVIIVLLRSNRATGFTLGYFPEHRDQNCRCSHSHLEVPVLIPGGLLPFFVPPQSLSLVKYKFFDSNCFVGVN